MSKDDDDFDYDDPPWATIKDAESGAWEIIKDAESGARCILKEARRDALKWQIDSISFVLRGPRFTEGTPTPADNAFREVLEERLAFLSSRRMREPQSPEERRAKTRERVRRYRERQRQASRTDAP